MREYDKTNENTSDPLEERVDPSSDAPTNLRDDSSMHRTNVEKETPLGERPDSHEGTTPGVDPRMAEAAAAFKSEHDEEEAIRKPFDRPTEDTE